MIADEHTLEELLSQPTEATCETLNALVGNIVVLGAGGKMGPTLAMMLKKAAPDKRIIAVSRFSDQDVKARIERSGVEVLALDLLDESTYALLPEVPNVFFLAGMKFGATGNQPLTWAMNVHLPSLVARHYKKARIVALSTGNVYPFTDINRGGSRETDTPEPVGEYAQSCLGRERMFQYFSEQYGTPVTLIRLNYANEPRYGILVDLAQKILSDTPIDVTMGHVNLIWQGDANNYIIRALAIAESPPTLLNVTGEKTLRVRDLAMRIGKRLGKGPTFVSEEAETALLSDAWSCIETFGEPSTTLDEMIGYIVDWVAQGHRTLSKPTKYNVRDGKF